MKSSPIATRLEYIYARRIQTKDRRKSTHRHTERLEIKHTESSLHAHTYTQRQNEIKVRAETTNTTMD